MEGHGGACFSPLQQLEGGPSATLCSRQYVSPFPHPFPASCASRTLQLFPSSSRASHQPVFFSASQAAPACRSSLFSQTIVSSSREASAVADVSASRWEAGYAFSSSDYSGCSPHQHAWKGVEGPPVAAPLSPFFSSPSFSLPPSSPAPASSRPPVAVSSYAPDAASSSVWPSGEQVSYSPSYVEGVVAASSPAPDNHSEAGRSARVSVSVALVPSHGSSASGPLTEGHLPGDALDFGSTREHPVYGPAAPTCSWKPCAADSPCGTCERASQGSSRTLDSAFALGTSGPADLRPTPRGTDGRYGDPAASEYERFSAFPVSLTHPAAYEGLTAKEHAEGSSATCDTATVNIGSHAVAGPQAGALEANIENKGAGNSAILPDDRRPSQATTATTSSGSTANASCSVHFHVDFSGDSRPNVGEAALPVFSTSAPPASQNNQGCFAFRPSPLGPSTAESCSLQHHRLTRESDFEQCRIYEERSTRVPAPALALASDGAEGGASAHVPSVPTTPFSAFVHERYVPRRPGVAAARFGLPSLPCASSSSATASSVSVQKGDTHGLLAPAGSYDALPPCASTDFPTDSRQSLPSGEACGERTDGVHREGNASMISRGPPLSAEAPYSTPGFSSGCPYRAPRFVAPASSPPPFSCPSSSSFMPCHSSCQRPLASSPASSSFIEHSARPVTNQGKLKSADTEDAPAASPPVFSPSLSSSPSLLHAAATLGSLWWRSTGVEGEADGRRRRGAGLSKVGRQCEGDKKREERNSENPELPGPSREKGKNPAFLQAGHPEDKTKSRTCTEKEETEETLDGESATEEGAASRDMHPSEQCSVGDRNDEVSRRRRRQEKETATHVDRLRRPRLGESDGEEEAEPEEEETDHEEVESEREEHTRRETERDKADAYTGASRDRPSISLDAEQPRFLELRSSPEGDKQTPRGPRNSDVESRERKGDCERHDNSSGAPIVSIWHREASGESSAENRKSSGQVARTVRPDGKEALPEVEEFLGGRVAAETGKDSISTGKDQGGIPAPSSLSSYSSFSSSLPFPASTPPTAQGLRDKKDKGETLDTSRRSPDGSVSSSPAFSAASSPLSPCRFPRSSPPFPGWGLAMMRRLLAGAMSDIDGEEDSDFSLSEDEDDDEDCLEDEEFDDEQLGSSFSKRGQKVTSPSKHFAPHSLLTGHFPSEEEDSDYTLSSAGDSGASSFSSSGSSSDERSPSISSHSATTSPSLSPASLSPASPSGSSASPLSPKPRGKLPRKRRPQHSRSPDTSSAAPASPDLSSDAVENSHGSKRSREAMRRTSSGASARRRKRRRGREGREKRESVSPALSENEGAADAPAAAASRKRRDRSRLQTGSRDQRLKHRSRTREKASSPFSSFCGGFSSSLPSPSAFWGGSGGGGCLMKSKRAKKEASASRRCWDIQTASAAVVPPPFPLAHVAHLVPQLKTEESSSNDSFSPILNGFSARQLRRLKCQMDLYVQLLMQTIYVIRNRCYGEDECEEEERVGDGDTERDGEGEGEEGRRGQGVRGASVESTAAEQKGSKRVGREEGVKDATETKSKAGDKLMRRAMMCCDSLIRGRLEQVNDLRARQGLSPLELQERLPFLDTHCSSPDGRRSVPFAVPLSSSPFSPEIVSSCSPLLASSHVGRVVDDSSGLVPFAGLATRTAAVGEGEDPRCSLLDFPLLRKIKQFLLLLEDRDSRFPRPLEEFLRLQQPFVDPAFLTGCYQRRRKPVAASRGLSGSLSSSSSARDSTADGPERRKGEARNEEANGGESNTFVIFTPAEDRLLGLGLARVGRRHFAFIRENFLPSKTQLQITRRFKALQRRWQAAKDRRNPLAAWRMSLTQTFSVDEDMLILSHLSSSFGSRAALASAFALGTPPPASLSKKYRPSVDLGVRSERERGRRDASLLPSVASWLLFIAKHDLKRDVTSLQKRARFLRHLSLHPGGEARDDRGRALPVFDDRSLVQALRDKTARAFSALWRPGLGYASRDDKREKEEGETKKEEREKKAEDEQEKKKEEDREKSDERKEMRWEAEDRVDGTRDRRPSFPLASPVFPSLAASQALPEEGSTRLLSGKAKTSLETDGEGASGAAPGSASPTQADRNEAARDGPSPFPSRMLSLRGFAASEASAGSPVVTTHTGERLPPSVFPSAMPFALRSGHAPRSLSATPTFASPPTTGRRRSEENEVGRNEGRAEGRFEIRDEGEKASLGDPLSRTSLGSTQRTSDSSTTHGPSASLIPPPPFSSPSVLPASSMLPASSPPSVVHPPRPVAFREPSADSTFDPSSASSCSPLLPSFPCQQTSASSAPSSAPCCPVQLAPQAPGEPGACLLAPEKGPTTLQAPQDLEMLAGLRVAAAPDQPFMSPHERDSCPAPASAAGGAMVRKLDAAVSWTGENGQDCMHLPFSRASELFPERLDQSDKALSSRNFGTSRPPRTACCAPFYQDITAIAEALDEMPCDFLLHNLNCELPAAMAFEPLAQAVVNCQSHMFLSRPKPVKIGDRIIRAKRICPPSLRVKKEIRDMIVKQRLLVARAREGRALGTDPAALALRECHRAAYWKSTSSSVSSLASSCSSSPSSAPLPPSYCPSPAQPPPSRFYPAPNPSFSASPLPSSLPSPLPSSVSSPFPSPALRPCASNETHALSTMKWTDAAQVSSLPLPPRIADSCYVRASTLTSPWLATSSAPLAGGETQQREEEALGEEKRVVYCLVPEREHDEGEEIEHAPEGGRLARQHQEERQGDSEDEEIEQIVQHFLLHASREDSPRTARLPPERPPDLAVTRSSASPLLGVRNESERLGEVPHTSHAANEKEDGRRGPEKLTAREGEESRTREGEESRTGAGCEEMTSDVLLGSVRQGEASVERGRREGRKGNSDKEGQAARSGDNEGCGEPRGNSRPAEVEDFAANADGREDIRPAEEGSFCLALDNSGFKSPASLKEKTVQSVTGRTEQEPEGETQTEQSEAGGQEASSEASKRAHEGKGEGVERRQGETENSQAENEEEKVADERSCHAKFSDSWLASVSPSDTSGAPVSGFEFLLPSERELESGQIEGDKSLHSSRPSSSSDSPVATSATPATRAFFSCTPLSSVPFPFPPLSLSAFTTSTLPSSVELPASAELSSDTFSSAALRSSFDLSSSTDASSSLTEGEGKVEKDEDFESRLGSVVETTDTCDGFDPRSCTVLSSCEPVSGGETETAETGKESAVDELVVRLWRAVLPNRKPPRDAVKRENLRSQIAQIFLTLSREEDTQARTE
ncbi:hypothetical protein TGVAND_319370 [Toxoplasma gondii VAND]|uniref:Uncharacterized protein n=1 Tax=Toxoplasma gondii VAND TaxID=933077 RepID=A0A086PUK0_TOXGO|nr:hypothetical protein TGVAND_319370 [Toxoplasma gondii VAND]